MEKSSTWVQTPTASYSSWQPLCFRKKTTDAFSKHALNAILVKCIALLRYDKNWHIMIALRIIYYIFTLLFRGMCKNWLPVPGIRQDDMGDGWMLTGQNVTNVPLDRWYGRWMNANRTKCHKCSTRQLLTNEVLYPDICSLIVIQLVLTMTVSWVTHMQQQQPCELLNIANIPCHVKPRSVDV